MNEFLEHGLNQNRRKFLSKMSLGLGGLALGSLMAPGLFNASTEDELFANVLPHFAPKANALPLRNIPLAIKGIEPLQKDYD